MKNALFAKVKAEYEKRSELTIKEVTSLQILVNNTIHNTIKSEIESCIYTDNSLEPVKLELANNLQQKEQYLIADYQTKTIARLNQNQEIHKLVMTDENSVPEASFAFKTNKLSELFNCAKDVLNNYGLSQLLYKPLMGNLHEQNISGFSFESASKNSTSYLNCVQTAFLTTLAIIENKDNFQDLNLTQKINSYNVETSPVVQTTAFPQSYIPTNYTLKDGTKFDITKWFYYYKDDKSPAQGELLIPNLGYQFGGSRSDARYDSKEFKSEDCSSAVSKWLGFEQSLSTADYELIYLNRHDNATINNNNLIRPFNNLIKLAPGHIFLTRTYDISKNPTKDDPKYAKGGHIGIITKILKASSALEEIEVEFISYNRNMPGLEGFIVENKTFTNEALMYYFIEYIGKDTYYIDNS